jgi:hypothetical protein
MLDPRASKTDSETTRCEPTVSKMKNSEVPGRCFSFQVFFRFFATHILSSTQEKMRERSCRVSAAKGTQHRGCGASIDFTSRVTFGNNPKRRKRLCVSVQVRAEKARLPKLRGQVHREAAFPAMLFNNRKSRRRRVPALFAGRDSVRNSTEFRNRSNPRLGIQAFSQLSQ